MAAASASGSQAGLQRLSTTQSDGNLSRTSAKRRERLIDLKKREDLKDALTEKFKGRFGHGAKDKGDDEVSVCSSAIKREVEDFAGRANVSQTNLERLEKRIIQRAKGKSGDDASSVVASGISAYSGLSSQKSRSVASLAGSNILSSKSGCSNFDWGKLDEYASYLHEQDAMRQKIGVQALRQKMRTDLDIQMEEKRKRKEYDQEEDRRYHQNSLLELERWKEQEKQREDERVAKLMKEKADRDEQLNFDRKLRQEELQKKKAEEGLLVNKIVTEMENEQRRYEKKKVATRDNMRKVFAENIEHQNQRREQKKAEMTREAAAMAEYNRILDEQEEQRERELKARIERQNKLVKDLTETTGAMHSQVNANDARRQKAQQDEMDRHYFEAEAMKQSRLKEMRLENQAYLVKQMQEKDLRKNDDKELQSIQAHILKSDAEEYNEIEQQREEIKRQLAVTNKEQIEKQIQWKRSQRPSNMSKHEVKMNKPLIHLVNHTLKARDASLSLKPVPEEE